MKANKFALKVNPNKYANLHKCDIPYWPFSCDFSQAQDADTLRKAVDDTSALLASILNAKAFKPENVADATELGKLVLEQNEVLFKDGADMAVSTFIVYQLQRYAFRIWYRDTVAARTAAKALTAPAKQETAKANEATFVSKLTKAQKKELLLSLMSELLK